MFNRIHKIEEYFEGQIYDSAVQLVEDLFECDVPDLTKEQVDMIEDWIENHEYSVMVSGFRGVIHWWEDANMTDDFWDEEELFADDQLQESS